MKKMLISMLLGIACAGATLYAQGNTYRVVSSYGELAVITFPDNDTVSEGGVTKYKHWVQITPLRLPLWVFLACNGKPYRQDEINQTNGDRNKDGSWITKKVVTPSPYSVNRPQAIYMIDGLPNGSWDIDWCIYDDLGNAQDIIPVQYQKISGTGQSGARRNDEKAQKDIEGLKKFEEKMGYSQ